MFFLLRTWVKAKAPSFVQQMKGVMGSLLAIAPFTCCMGRFCWAPKRSVVNGCGRAAVDFDPVAFGYSVSRYRLMDVELVVRRVLFMC